MNISIPFSEILTAVFITGLAIIHLVYGWQVIKRKKRLLPFPIQIGYWLSVLVDGKTKADQRAAIWLTEQKLMLFGIGYLIFGAIFLMFGLLLLYESIGSIVVR